MWKEYREVGRQDQCGLSIYSYTSILIPIPSKSMTQALYYHRDVWLAYNYYTLHTFHFQTGLHEFVQCGWSTVCQNVYIYIYIYMGGHNYSAKQNYDGHKL